LEKTYTYGGRMMIGFNALGSLGRLGNQMFQYSSLRGVAKNRNFDWCIPNSDGVREYHDHRLFNTFEMTSVKDENIQLIPSNSYVEESCFHFDENLFNNCPDNISIFGYFQTEKYFSNVKDIIKKDFVFKKDILNPCLEYYNSLGTKKVISLHIRRGDYLVNSENHPPCSIEYYEQALKQFSDYDKVIIFSDDSEWCKEQELFDGDNFLVSETGDQFLDLCLMTLCNGHIIANSSFSWWGAWLSNTEKVVAPSKWFGPALENKKTHDVYCEGWIKI
jgi:hypothetical protein